jgi:hypothetical protein
VAQSTPAMSAASVKPTSLPINKLLSERYPARVPRYQRAYAWNDDQVTDLINDIKLLLPKKTGTRGHFYGGMVAIALPDASETSGSTYEIVDGQQRLATFCLLLAQLATRADELELACLAAGKKAESKRLAILARDIRRSYLHYQRYDVDQGTESTEPRVRLSVADDGVFQGLVDGTPVVESRESHRLLMQAAGLLREELVLPETSEADPTKARKQLVRLRDAVLLDSFVIHIVGDSRSSGYRLFAVLNDRGARLTVADLLRSHTLELLDAHKGMREKCATTWDDILTRGAELVDDFLMVYFTSLTGKRSKRSDLFDQTKDLLFAPSTTPQQILAALTSMGTELGAYMSIRSGHWPYEQADHVAGVADWHRDRLARLVGTLRHDLSAPLLLAARARCDEERFAELVHALEKFAFRYKNVCGAHAGPASAIYYGECKKLRGLPAGSVVTFVPFRQALTKLIAKRAPDKVFKASLRDQLAYDAGSAAKANIRYLLTMIEAHGPWLNQGAVPPLAPSVISVTDFSQVTIEHVYAPGSKPPDLVLRSHENRLGNLSYWAPGDNSTASNQPFAAKVAAYAASSVGLNQDLAQLGQWDKPALEAREQHLIDAACLVFTV